MFLLAGSNQRIAFLAMIVFPALLFGGLLLQWLVKSLRYNTDMALYELSRGPIETVDQIPDEEKLPGYDTLTKKDYDELYETLKSEMINEMVKNGITPKGPGNNNSKSK